MDLNDTTTVPAAALPVAVLRDHLRLGGGFADDTTQDGLLERYLRAAVDSIEARTGKILLGRAMLLRLRAWRGHRVQPLPVAPVTAITAVDLIDRMGTVTAVDSARWRLEPDRHQPRLAATGALLPTIPDGGMVAIAFEAGFGPLWEDLPADLAQAVLLLAAQLYEDRAGVARDTAQLPAPVVALTARWRLLRAGGGRT